MICSANLFLKTCTDKVSAAFHGDRRRALSMVKVFHHVETTGIANLLALPNAILLSAFCSGCGESKTLKD